MSGGPTLKCSHIVSASVSATVSASVNASVSTRVCVSASILYFDHKLALRATLCGKGFCNGETSVFYLCGAGSQDCHMSVENIQACHCMCAPVCVYVCNKRGLAANDL